MDNPPGLAEIAYRVGNHGQFLSSMLARLSSPAFPALAALTVRDTEDESIALLDAGAILGDLLTFYTERIANEGYLRTATEEQSLRLLGRLVGHLPRPGVAASTYLAYTLDRDPRAEQDTASTIPRGARAQSVPGQGQEPQSFETSEELPARWSWNDLKVRLRRPYQLLLEQLDNRGRVHLAGTATNVKPGDRLLFVFGTEKGRQSLQVVPHVEIDQQNNVTVVGLPGTTPPTLDGLATEFRDLITAAKHQASYLQSRIVARFVDDVLGGLGSDLPSGARSFTPAEAATAITTPTEFGLRLDAALARLVETMVLAEPYPDIRTWFAQWLLPKLVAMRAKVALLEPPRQRTPATLLASATAASAMGVAGSAMSMAAVGTDTAPPADAGVGTPPASNTPATAAPATSGLAALLTALRRGPTRPPASARDLVRRPSEIYAPGSDIGARLLAELDARLREGLYPAWQRVDLTAPLNVQAVQAMRIVATPFGATAPFKPDYDAQGRLIGYVDWPLLGNQVLTVRISYRKDTPDEAVLSWSEASQTARLTQPLDSNASADFGPGRVEVTVHPPSKRGDPPPHEPGVTLGFFPDLPRRTLFVSSHATDPSVHVTIGNGDLLDFHLNYGDVQRAQQGGVEVTVARTAADRSTRTPEVVEVSFAASLVLSSRNVLALDAVYEGIGAGSWVVVQRPRKGEKGGVPGNPAFSKVITQVRSARVVSRADFGITGKVTELTLAGDWLDDRDRLLSHIRDATVYARGEPVRLATEPIIDDVAGGEIELAELYQELTPGRWVVVSGERTDIPHTSGVTGTELAMIASVRQNVEPALPGDAVHTTITLATPLSYRYRRDTVQVSANVVAATHGTTRDEPIGSGDASKSNQTFRLFQGPLTWLAADTPLGAHSTVEIRVDGVLWHEVDSLAGRGPAERVYVTSTEQDGRTSITFGDGVRGARLPTGYENVRARYRVGVGMAANVAARKITQAITRPLWVSGVTNPLPATGGANPDDITQARGNIPLAVTALDRLLSVPDYEDFARERAGIGRASARRLFDGTREIVHVTVAGVDDVPLAEDSDVVRALHSSLTTFGDPQLPVAVAIRELVLLVVSANIRVRPDYSWQFVEPAVRAALLRRLGFAHRELGQPAYPSEALAAAQSVPGVDYVDLEVFAGVSASITPRDLEGLAERFAQPAAVVPARPATFEESRYVVSPPPGQDSETLTEVATRNGITLAELVRLNTDIADATPLPRGRSVVVFRGVRPARLVTLSPVVSETLILKEVRS